MAATRSSGFLYLPLCSPTAWIFERTSARDPSYYDEAGGVWMYRLGREIGRTAADQLGAIFNRKVASRGACAATPGA
jgi:hypothetical protein